MESFITHQNYFVALNLTYLWNILNFICNSDRTMTLPRPGWVTELTTAMRMPEAIYNQTPGLVQWPSLAHMVSKIMAKFELMRGGQWGGY